MIKKLFQICIVATTSLIVMACGTSNTSNDLDSIIDNGVIRVGMSLKYPPFETKDGSTPDGISVDLSNSLGSYLSTDDNEVKVEIVDTDFSNLIVSLEQRKIDVIIGSMSITEARREAIDFSDPYFHFKIISLLNNDFVDTFEKDINEITADDLLSKTEARYVGLSGQISSSLPIENGVDPDYVKTVSETSIAIEEVVSGNSDVFIMSASTIANGHMTNPDTTEVLWEPLSTSPIGMGVKKGNDKLLEKLNEFISTLDDDGGIYDSLRSNWDTTIEDILGIGKNLDFYIYK